MEIQPDVLYQERLRKWSGYLMIILIAITLVTWAGWQFDIDFFKHPVPHLAAMNPITAISLLFLSVSFKLLVPANSTPRQKLIGNILVTLITILALLKIVSILLGWNLHIDQLLYNEKIQKENIENVTSSMRSYTAIDIVLAALSLFLYKYKNIGRVYAPSQYVAALVGALGILSIMGYLFHMQVFYGLMQYFPMSLPAAICFTLFSIAFLFADSSRGFMREFTSVHSGSVMAKMLVPAAVIIPVVLGLLRRYGNFNFYSDQFGLAAYALSIILCFLVLIWYNAYLLNKRDAQNKKMEEDLVNSEEQVKAIFDYAPDAILVIDSQSTIVRWNTQAENLFGWKEEEVIGKSLADIILPEEFRESHRKGMSRYITTGESTILGKNIDIWAIKKDKTDIDVSLTISPMIVNGQKFFNGFMRDITEKKRLEEKLQSFNRELELEVENKTRQLKEILERITDGFIALDKDFRYIYANKKIGEISNRDSASLIGKYVWDEFPEAVGSSTYHAFYEAMKEQKYILNVDYFTPLDLWQENHIYPSPEGISVFVRDISVQKRGERKLEASESRFRAIIEQFPFPVMTLNNEGDFTTVNKAWETMWKADRSELKEYNIHKDSQLRTSGLYKYVEKAFAGEIAIADPYLYDPSLLNHPGSPRWIIATLFPVKSKSDEILEVILVLQDISESKKAEEKINESYQAIRELTSYLQNIREEERKHIAREIHDELGQLLTVLKMDASWLNKKLSTPTEDIKEKMEDLLQTIDKTVKTVRRISSELRPTLLDDIGLTAAIEWHAEEFEKRSGIQVELQVPENIAVPDDVKIGLFRIFQESMTNVARHSGARKVTVFLKQDEQSIVMRITDDGKGYDNTIKGTKTLGVLGMKERTLMMGGEYHIHGVKDQGTTIEVIIPAKN